MPVSVEDFSREPKKYIDLVQKQEIEIASNGEMLALLSAPNSAKKKAVNELLKLSGRLAG